MQPVNNKTDFVRRFRNGEFGNKLRTWEWYEWQNYFDANQEKLKGQLFHLRNKEKGGLTRYNLSASLINEYLKTMGNGFYVSEMAPHKDGTLQGEIQQTEKGLYLRYTFAKLPMRDAFIKQELHVYNLQAKHLIRTYMNQASLEWLDHLLEEYDGHIIEFSCFNHCLGTIAGRNTVFWEVRNY